jgi:hypothetical protein
MALNTNPADPNNRRQGSGFTNLQNIMQANVGNRLGSAVGQGIQKAGEQTKQGLTQAQDQFKQQSEAGRLDTDENKQKVSTVLEHPENANDQDFNQFDQFRAGQYSGPQDLSNVNDLRGQAQEAQQLSKATSSQEGRQGLLQRYAAGPGSYGSGQQRLDTLLLGASGGQQLKDARRSVSGIGQQVAGASQGAQGVAQQYKNLAQGFGQDVTNQTTTLAQQAQKAAEDKAAAANAADAAMRSKTEQDLANLQQNNFSQDQLDALGLKSGQMLYGLNPADYAKYQGNDALNQAGLESVTSQDDYQKFANLRRLMGGNTSEYDPTKVNTYKAGQENFNKDALQTALGQKEKEYNDILNPAKDWHSRAYHMADIYNGKNITSDEKQDFLAHNPDYAVDPNTGQIGKKVFSFSGPPTIDTTSINPEMINTIIGQDLIKRTYAPAAGFGPNYDIRAIGQYFTDSINNLNDTQNRLSQQYGGLANLMNPPDMEKTPTVS